MQVLALVEKTVGANTFTAAYNGVRTHMDENKRKRKATIALEAISDPQKAAQRKVAKSEMKKRQRAKSKDNQRSQKPRR